MAEELDGKLLIPDMDDATFESAIVEAVVDGHALRIDFLTNVLGVRPNALESSVVEILVPCQRNGQEGMAAIPLMHPLHCLQSRVANVIKLGRSDDVARRQLEASPVVLREYIAEALGSEDTKEATRSLQRLYQYLRSDIYGRRAHDHMRRDPLELLEHFAADERIDERFRRLSIGPMIDDLASRRETRAANEERRQSAWEPEKR